MSTKATSLTFNNAGLTLEQIRAVMAYQVAESHARMLAAARENLKDEYERLLAKVNQGLREADAVSDVCRFELSRLVPDWQGRIVHPSEIRSSM